MYFFLIGNKTLFALLALNDWYMSNVLEGERDGSGVGGGVIICHN